MSRQSRGRRVRRLLVIVVATLTPILSSVSPAPPPPAAWAQIRTITWNGGGAFGPFWSTSFNWLPVDDPALDTDIVFDGTSVRDVLIDQPLPGANSLTINQGYTGTFSANPGVLLELTNGLTMARTASVTLPVEISATQSQTWQVPEVLGVLTVTGPVHLPAILTVNSSGNVVFSGPVVGTSANSLIKSGGGALRFTGAAANTYAGLTLVSVGTLLLDKTNGPAVPGALFIGNTSGSDTVRLLRPEQIGDASPVTINSSGRLDLNNQDETIGSLTGSGSVLLGSGTLTVGGNGSNTMLSGPITGSGGVTKVGSGTLQLTSSSNAYTGATTMSSGALVLTGTLPGPIALTGGSLFATGSMGSITATGGTLSPESAFSTGFLSATALDLAPAVTMKLLILGTGPLDADSVTVSGPVHLDGAALAVTSVGTIPAGLQFVIIGHSGSGPIGGTFATLPEGAVLLAPGPGGGTLFRITYHGDGGSDVVLTSLGSACSPRPPVQLHSQASGGKLQVTVSSTPFQAQGSQLNNPIASLTFSRLDNASVVLNGQSVAAGQTVQLAPNTLASTFTLSRVTSGHPSTVQLAATDTCGSWRTFVGGGATAF